MRALTLDERLNSFSKLSACDFFSSVRPYTASRRTCSGASQQHINNTSHLQITAPCNFTFCHAKAMFASHSFYPSKRMVVLTFLCVSSQGPPHLLTPDGDTATQPRNIVP